MKIKNSGYKTAEDFINAYNSLIALQHFDSLLYITLGDLVSI